MVVDTLSLPTTLHACWQTADELVNPPGTVVQQDLTVSWSRRSKHRHHLPERKRHRPDAEDSKHASKRLRHEVDAKGDPSSHDGHRRRSHRERERGEKTVAADGTVAAPEADTAVGEDATMADATGAGGGQAANAEIAAMDGEANGKAAHAVSDGKQRRDGDGKQERGVSRDRGREHSRERSSRGGDESERRRDDRRELSRDRRRERDGTSDRGAARDADRHASRDRGRDSERERERRWAAERLPL